MVMAVSDIPPRMKSDSLRTKLLMLQAIGHLLKKRCPDDYYTQNYEFGKQFSIDCPACLEYTIEVLAAADDPVAKYKELIFAHFNEVGSEYHSTLEHEMRDVIATQAWRLRK
jgi:hypothetical protein